MFMKPLKPDWVSQPWMYHVPKKPEEIPSWTREWIPFVVKWCETENRHVVSISEVLVSDSFRTPVAGVSPIGVRKIFEQMIENGLAKWVDENKTLLRVYWRTIAQWADIIVKWAVEGGGITFDPYMLSQADKNFSNLPKPDLEEIIAYLAEKGQAEWIDMRKRLVRLRI
jgi:hypothetical protein